LLPKVKEPFELNSTVEPRIGRGIGCVELSGGAGQRGLDGSPLYILSHVRSLAINVPTTHEVHPDSTAFGEREEILGKPLVASSSGC
jgi:hypothetical protein